MIRSHVVSAAAAAASLYLKLASRPSHLKLVMGDFKCVIQSVRGEGQTDEPKPPKRGSGSRISHKQQ